jgi:hypothetical protein
LALKTKCSIKIKDEDKFVQPPMNIRNRQHSIGLCDTMSASEVIINIEKFEKYKVAIALKRIEEKKQVV